MQKASIIAVVTLAGLLSACGQGDSAPKTSAAAPAPAAAPAEPATPTTAPVAAEPVAGAPTPPPPAAVADAAGGDDKGKAVFGKTCALCHASGVAGAPIPGNKDQWGPRIAQGKETLYKHAMEGFTGQSGMMPPRGGNSALSDEEIKAAVNYMVGKSS